MYPTDRRERAVVSQSVNKFILNIRAVYEKSPVPVCIRTDERKILYENHSFSELFSRVSLEDGFSGRSYSQFDTELTLSRLENECIRFGQGAAICRTFFYRGDIYQIRMENILQCDECCLVFWQINLFPDMVFFEFDTRKTLKSKSEKDVSLWIYRLSPRMLVTLCLYTIGFHEKIIAVLFGISSSAARKRINVINERVKEYFDDFDLFRRFCLSCGYTKIMLSILNECFEINVCDLLKNTSPFYTYRRE